MQLRPYQVEAVTKTIETMKKGVKRPLIIAPTASGKSILVAEIVRRCTSNNKRVLVLCHQGHLLAQNEEKINIIAPDIETGIFCAGQKRKDRTQQVILASRDSLGNNPRACGPFDLIICDEAHMIPIDAMKNGKTNYGKIFTSLGCPFVIGLTGTPWRLSTGTIFGPDKFFTKVSYNIKMRKLIRDGYLSDYSFPNEEIREIDAGNLTIASTGDYRTADLNTISMPDEVVEKCIDHWERLASDRKCSIFFACSRDHAAVIEDHLKSRIGENNVAYIDGETKGREQILESIVEGKYRAVVNIGVLTTGFDASLLDCVVFLRATTSASLFVQMCLDLDTEVLTKRGWAKHDDISYQDVAITYDIETGERKESPVKNIVNRQTQEGEKFVSASGPGSFNFKVTGGHDMIARCKKDFKKIKAEDLIKRKSHAYIPVSAKGYKNQNEVPLSDDEIKLIAWLLTDGCWNGEKYRASIYQSTKWGYHLEIEDMLKRLDLKYSVLKKDKGSDISTYRHNYDLYTYRINKRLLYRISSYLEDIYQLDQLSERQFNILMEVVIKADGSKEKGFKPENIYKSKYRISGRYIFLEKLQCLCVVNGWRADITIKKSGDAVLNVSKVKERCISKPNKRLKETGTEEKVWCIETDQGTIITRRGGKVTIMGNCGRGLRLHPGKKDCLMLDMAGNFERFYSIEEPLADSCSKKESEPKPKDCPRCLKENPPGTSICQHCECELPKGGPVKTCKECLTENYSAATKCGFCGNLFISHDTNVYKANKGIFRYPVHNHTIFENVVSKKGNKYCRIELMAGNRGQFLADKYFINLFIYGKGTVSEVARGRFDKFRTHDPAMIQVYRDGKSKYPIVDVCEWKPKEITKDNCIHRWDFDYSPCGQKIVFCVLCDKLKEGK